MFILGRMDRVYIVCDKSVNLDKLYRRVMEIIYFLCMWLVKFLILINLVFIFVLGNVVGGFG